MNTEVGKIANMLANKKVKHHFKKTEMLLVMWLTIMILVIAVIIFVVGCLEGTNGLILTKGLRVVAYDSRRVTSHFIKLSLR